jgi:hypothetical protein
MFFSNNNGANWKDISNGVSNTNIMSLAIIGSNIYAGTYGSGVWKRPLSEILDVNEIESRNEELELIVYPNPVKHLSIISYQLPTKSRINLSIFDLTGRQVKIIDNGELRMENRKYSVNIDVGDFRSGVYFVKLETNEGIRVMKIIKN